MRPNLANIVSNVGKNSAYERVNWNISGCFNTQSTFNDNHSKEEEKRKLLVCVVKIISWISQMGNHSSISDDAAGAPDRHFTFGISPPTAKSLFEDPVKWRRNSNDFLNYQYSVSSDVLVIRYPSLVKSVSWLSLRLLFFELQYFLCIFVIYEKVYKNSLFLNESARLE